MLNHVTSYAQGNAYSKNSPVNVFTTPTSSILFSSASAKDQLTAYLESGNTDNAIRYTLSLSNDAQRKKALKRLVNQDNAYQAQKAVNLLFIQATRVTSQDKVLVDVLTELIIEKPEFIASALREPQETRTALLFALNIGDPRQRRKAVTGLFQQSFMQIPILTILLQGFADRTPGTRYSNLNLLQELLKQAFERDKSAAMGAVASEFNTSEQFLAFAKDLDALGQISGLLEALKYNLGIVSPHRNYPGLVFPPTLIDECSQDSSPNIRQLAAIAIEYGETRSSVTPPFDSIETITRLTQDPDLAVRKQMVSTAVQLRNHEACRIALEEPLKTGIPLKRDYDGVWSALCRNFSKLPSDEFNTLVSEWGNNANPDAARLAAIAIELWEHTHHSSSHFDNEELALKLARDPSPDTASQMALASMWLNDADLRHQVVQNLQARTSDIPVLVALAQSAEVMANMDWGDRYEENPPILLHLAGSPHKEVQTAVATAIENVFTDRFTPHRMDIIEKLAESAYPEVRRRLAYFAIRDDLHRIDKPEEPITQESLTSVELLQKLATDPDPIVRKSIISLWHRYISYRTPPQAVCNLLYELMEGLCSDPDPTVTAALKQQIKEFGTDAQQKALRAKIKT